MRVLHVYRTYLPDTQGGLEETIRQLCLSTGTLGTETRVLCLSRNPIPKEVEREETTVIRFRLHAEIASCGMSLTALAAFSREAKWADIIHYHFPWPFADALHLLTKPGAKTVLTYHSDIVRQNFLKILYKPLMRRFLNSVDRVVCTSPNYFATSEELTRYERKLSIVPIGIDEDSYPRPERASLEECEKTFGRDFFFFVGVLRYYKGLFILLNAAAKQSFQVVIAGSGPTERSLKEQAEKLELENVKFAGHISDKTKSALFSLSRAIVFPSYLRSEAFGVTLLEGAMHSKPLISTEVGTGTSHVNHDGETGLIVAPGSASELRSAMNKLHEDPELARSLGINARRRYERYFTAKEMGKSYHQLYSDVLFPNECNT